MIQIENTAEQAAEFWRNDKALDAGRIIFEMVPPNVRPKWAATILRFATTGSKIVCPPVQEIVDITELPDEWGKAHQIFAVLREATLELEAKRRKGLTKEENLRIKLLLIAELVAKIMYNATNPPDEFDEDSGWWIAVTLKDFVDFLGDEAFSKEAWLVFSTWPKEIATTTK